MRHIRMSSPDLSGDELAVVADVLKSADLSLGPRIVEFERRFATFIGAPHAAGVSSGTAALHLAMIAGGVGDGDLVITTPFSFVASANCVLYQRATPVFVDVAPVTGNIDPTLVDEAVADLTSGRRCSRGWERSLRSVSSVRERLKALLPVHAFGQPADMDPLIDLARTHQLSLVEDACEAIGALYKGRRVGTLGDAAAFAFYPNKQMTTGEGGMLTTRHEGWDKLFRSLRNQGRDVFDAWLTHSRLGYNYRLNELSAALGIAQLSRIDELLAKRARVASWYTERLITQEGLQTPVLAPTTTRMSWFVYVVRLDVELDRRTVMASLAERGIPTRPYFEPIHLQPFYVEQFGYRRGDFPVAELLGDTCLALPFSATMTEDDVSYVCDQVAEVIDRQLAHDRVAFQSRRLHVS